MNNRDTDQIKPEAKSSEILKEVTGLTNSLLAEVLSYLPFKEPILSNRSGLDFFSDRELVFQVRIRDNYRINWADCTKHFGSENLYSPSIAYNYFKLYYKTPSWDSAYETKTEFVSMLHPYVPACALKCIPDDKTYLTNLISTWADNSPTEKEAWRYGMWLACIVGNLNLVRSLIELNCKPSQDDFHNAIRLKHSEIVKLLVDKNDKFQLNMSQYSLNLAIENGDIDIFNCMLGSYSVSDRLDVIEASIKEAERMIYCDQDSLAKEILNSLRKSFSENTDFKVDNSSEFKMNSL